MNILILKLGATGDVVRTTTLLRRLRGHISWITAANNVALLDTGRVDFRGVAWEQREECRDRHYDLVINLEDTLEIAQFLTTISTAKTFGAYTTDNRALLYTEESRGWFDLSLISSFGKAEADRLKLLNRRSYQDLIFAGLGLPFEGEAYMLPPPISTGLSGDVAISPAAGPVWPMKNWAFYGQLKIELENAGLAVNILPKRSSLREHLGDVQNHRCLVSGDSLPMHLALGTGTRCVTLFTCTSPWEIHDYGIQRKVISPLLAEFFYQRGLDTRATMAIPVEAVYEATMAQFKLPSAVPQEQLQHA